jgi:hypothetical protein
MEGGGSGSNQMNDGSSKVDRRPLTTSSYFESTETDHHQPQGRISNLDRIQKEYESAMQEQSHHNLDHLNQEEEEVKFVNIHELNEKLMLQRLVIRTFIFFIYFISGAFILNYWMEWDALESLYFTVITFTTVGTVHTFNYKSYSLFFFFENSITKSIPGNE